MDNIYFERGRGSLKAVLTQIVMTLAVLLLLSNCGVSKKTAEVSVGSVTDVVESKESEMVPGDDCALLHIYRKSSMVGAAIGYDLLMDGDKVFRAKNKSKTTIRVTEAGMKTLSAKTESKTELPLDVQLGNEYYIRCGVKMGALVARPKLEVLDNHTGKAEFEKIPLKKD